MNYVKKFLTSTPVKRFAWHTANGFVGLAIVYLSGENIAWTIPVIAFLNGMTKYLNTQEEAL